MIKRERVTLICYVSSGCVGSHYLNTQQHVTVMPVTLPRNMCHGQQVKGAEILPLCCTMYSVHSAHQTFGLTHNDESLYLYDGSKPFEAALNVFSVTAAAEPSLLSPAHLKPYLNILVPMMSRVFLMRHNTLI
jgi:hypothetical protein